MTRIWQVDAFTKVPFKGNPAGVCLLDGPVHGDWMQAVAAEMNVAETAFVWPEGTGFRLRWFTPTIEVDLCGHATLASAHILWESETLDRGQRALFITNSGELAATSENGWIVLDFPSEPPASEIDANSISEAIGVEALSGLKNRFDFLAEVESEQVVRDLAPDIKAINALDCRGLIVTARSEDDRYDFVSRFFAPAVGVDEDPVTGSAHCFLCPYWAERLGKTTMTGYQTSKRGGVVKVELHGDRVNLAGQAVTVLDARLTG